MRWVGGEVRYALIINGSTRVEPFITPSAIYHLPISPPPNQNRDDGNEQESKEVITAVAADNLHLVAVNDNRVGGQDA